MQCVIFLRVNYVCDAQSTGNCFCTCDENCFANLNIAQCRRFYESFAVVTIFASTQTIHFGQRVNFCCMLLKL